VSVLPRNAADRVQELLEAFRLVVLGGARQTGKTTLVSELLDLAPASQYTFDDEATLARATDDPVGFLEVAPRPATIDEFQRAGRGFLLAVKQTVDRHRQRGQLLLTGSTSYVADRSVSETLAGRAGRIMLWPLSAGEQRGLRETFVDRCFDEAAWPPASSPALGRAELVEWILEGGYPEIVIERLEGRRRRDWFDAYVTDVVSREALRPLAEVRMERELRGVLRLLAARAAGELVVADLAADAGLSRETTSNYVALLEALHLVVMIPGWATSATTRAKRRPKVLLVDTGLAANLVGAGTGDFGPNADGRVAGALFESLVTAEIYKQATWSRTMVDLSHFRDRNGPEVDLVLEERRSSKIAGIEVKLTSTPTARHARHLALLRDRLGKRFIVGLVIHAGPQRLPLGDRLWALPVSALWRTD
jgi:predicted AAA+ superfamily ATPase